MPPWPNLSGWVSLANIESGVRFLTSIHALCQIIDAAGVTNVNYFFSLATIKIPGWGAPTVSRRGAIATLMPPWGVV